MLWNLVRNGVQASGAGTRVTVRVGEKNGRVTMSVTDQGPGIEVGSEEKIFDAFFTTRSHGAGMGLAVVRRIVDDHAPFGATIEVRNGAAGGAIFEVGLASAPAAARRANEALPGGTQRLAGASESSETSATAGSSART